MTRSVFVMYRTEVCYIVVLYYYFKDPVECLFGDQGLYYMGITNTTVSGRPCQMWSSQTPHSHTMSGEANYCRNPDKEPKPWCYTTDPDVRYEFCDIPSCGKLYLYIVV